MSDISAWLPYLAIAGIAYLAFVFTSESLNPFRMRKGPNRLRWRLARSLAAIFFAASTIGLLLEPHLKLPRLHVVLVVTTLCFIFSLYPINKYFRTKNRSVRTLRKNNKREPTANNSANTAQKITTKTTAAELSSDTPKRSTAQLDLITQEPRNFDISASEEHKLELELSHTNRGDRFDYLDQTIAEADFINADLTMSEIQEVAQPNQPPLPDNPYTIDVDNVANLSNSTHHNLVDELLHQHENTLDEASSDFNEALLRRFDAQNEEIKSLAKINLALSNNRALLVDELAKLKYSLQKSNAVARKSTAQLNEAIKVKDSALNLVIMERKKRQLTEIKARKAILKMKTTLKNLTDQRA